MFCGVVPGGNVQYNKPTIILLLWSLITSTVSSAILGERLNIHGCRTYW